MSNDRKERVEKEKTVTVNNKEVSFYGRFAKGGGDAAYFLKRAEEILKDDKNKGLTVDVNAFASALQEKFGGGGAPVIPGGGAIAKADLLKKKTYVKADCSLDDINAIIKMLKEYAADLKKENKSVEEVKSVLQKQADKDGIPLKTLLKKIEAIAD